MSQQDLLNIQSISNILIDEQKGYFNYLVNYFLTRSKNDDCFNLLSHILNERTSECSVELKLDFNMHSNINKKTLILFSKKIIGWFFNHPITVISFLLSIYERHYQLKEILELIIDPIYINYPEVCINYLNKKINHISMNNKSNLYLYYLIKECQNSFKNICYKNAPRELIPSLHERNLYFSNFNEITKTAYKYALKNSLVSTIAKNVTVLYGRGYIGNYISVTDGKHQTYGAQFHKFTTGTTMPNYLYLDPNGIEILINQFRKDKLEQ